MTDLSPVALKFLRAYVHGMALRLIVDDDEGVFPDVLGALASVQDIPGINAALTELEDAGIVAGHSEPRGGPCIWITPNGIRRAVAEGFVEPRFAWTLWPHDDLQYEAVLAEMGDHAFDRAAAEEWREAVIEMLDEKTLDEASHFQRMMLFIGKAQHRLMPSVAEAVAVGAADHDGVRVGVLYVLLGANEDPFLQNQSSYVIDNFVKAGLLECDGDAFDPWSSVKSKRPSKALPTELLDEDVVERAMATHQRLSGRP